VQGNTSVWTSSRNSWAWEEDGLKGNKWDFPNWQASQNSSWSLGEVFILQIFNTQSKALLLGWPSSLCLISFTDKYAHESLLVLVALSSWYNPSLSIPFRRTFLVTLSFTEQQSWSNSTIALLSQVSLDTLNKFLMICGTYKHYVDWKC